MKECKTMARRRYEENNRDYKTVCHDAYRFIKAVAVMPVGDKV